MKTLSILSAALISAAVLPATAALNSAGTFTGNVGVSIDGVGSNNAAVGNVLADIPIGATILQAFLYSAGTPFPWYDGTTSLASPTTLADYNGAGISLAGTVINNFDTLVGATSTPRPDIGQWFTARADVTALVQAETAGAATNNFSWAVTEGSLNSRIDGEVLAIVYEHASQPLGSVALLDGGQDTGGETTTVNLGAPLTDPSAPGFAAQLSLGISFSCCNQKSTVEVNGALLTDQAGDNDDGATTSDGSLITVGGIGDDPSNNVGAYGQDDELYDLSPFLSQGDTSFKIETTNATGDDNIFFAALNITAQIDDVVPGIPEPETYALMLAGLGMVGFAARRRRTGSTS